MSNSLKIAYDFEFELIGLSSSEVEYRIAWELNKLLNQRFVLKEEIVLNLKSGQYNVMNYFSGNNQIGIQLVKNKFSEIEGSTQTCLIPELKAFDYFLLLFGFKSNEIAEKLKKSKFVIYSQIINIETLKSKENLILY